VIDANVYLGYEGFARKSGAIQQMEDDAIPLAWKDFDGWYLKHSRNTIDETITERFIKQVKWWKEELNKIYSESEEEPVDPEYGDTMKWFGEKYIKPAEESLKEFISKY